MTAALIALFISSAASAASPPRTPVQPLAGKARQLDAVMTIDDEARPLDLLRPTIHVTGWGTPAFKPRLDPRGIA